MKPTISSASVGFPESSIDLLFGFDERNYSDRTLLLHIIDNHVDQHIHATSAADAPRKRKKTIHINSLILAGRSVYFRKLFSNGMKESELQQINIQIEASEEVPFMDLLKYIYSNTVPTTQSGLVHLLVMADKFEVESCMRECSGSLLKSPMTCKYAKLYLNLPSSLLVSPAIHPLIAAAKKFVVAHFNDLDKYKEEMLKLPLAGIEAILSNDDLQVTSEFDVYNFFLRWARSHYSDLEERREIYKKYLFELIRFSFIPTPKLIVGVKSCNDIDKELASNIFIHSLCFNMGTQHQNCLVGEKGSYASRQHVERAYKNRPVKVLELDMPHKQCIVYLHFTKEALKRIFPGGHIMSEGFQLGREEVVLSARCKFIKGRNQYYFCLGIKVVAVTACTINYKIAVRMQSSNEFERFEDSLNITEPEIKSFGLGLMEWTSSIDDNSKYFINGILYMSVEFTIMKKS